MKVLTLILAIGLSTTTLFAGNISMSLPKDALSFYLITGPQLLKVEGEPMETTEATVKLTLQGCADQLGPYNYSLSKVRVNYKTKVKVDLYAYGIGRELSTRMDCLVAKTVDVVLDMAPFGSAARNGGVIIETPTAMTSGTP